MQSKQWTAYGRSTPKRAKAVLSAGKVMATVFWDSRGVIFIDYLQKGKTITRAYYASLLDRLEAEIAEKRPHLQKKNLVPSRQCAVSHLNDCHGKNPRITA
ncbi:hypothetical protein ANTQUA_LOCUS5971 [Anthophora quadrimaculata]